MKAERVIVCGRCRVVQWPAPCEHELASVNVELLERRESPIVTHTICPACRQLLVAEAAGRAA